MRKRPAHVFPGKDTSQNLFSQAVLDVGEGGVGSDALEPQAEVV